MREGEEALQHLREQAAASLPATPAAASYSSILTLAEPEAMGRGEGVMAQGKEVDAWRNAEKYGKRKVGARAQGKEWRKIPCLGPPQREEHGVQLGDLPSLVLPPHFSLRAPV